MGLCVHRDRWLQNMEHSKADAIANEPAGDVTVSVCLLFGVGVDRWKLDRWTVTRGCRADGRQKAESETAGGMESCMGSRWMD